MTNLSTRRCHCICSRFLAEEQAFCGKPLLFILWSTNPKAQSLGFCSCFFFFHDWLLPLKSFMCNQYHIHLPFLGALIVMSKQVLPPSKKFRQVVTSCFLFLNFTFSLLLLWNPSPSINFLKWKISFGAYPIYIYHSYGLQEFTWMYTAPYLFPNTSLSDSKRIDRA